MNIKRYLTFKKLFLSACAIMVLIAGTAWFCNWYINRCVQGRIYSKVEDIPKNHVGLLLGTSKLMTDGQTINPYYRYRIEAADVLMKSGKIDYLVISGDNSHKNYNEPEDMRQSLIALGIDSNRILLDYAGFRTFDSVIRLREIFGQHQVTIISQAFHNERAVYIAGREGIDAIAFNAKDVGKRFGLKVMLREKLARVKVFVDYLTFMQPKFLGPKIDIPAGAI